jgi:glycosyltransferase involved in cell wall biosynthesis
MTVPGAPPSGPLVSCLCVTESRPEFWPWLWWGFAKQDHEQRELVVVDSSPCPLVSDDPRVRVVPAVPGTSVAVKRNLALREARGSVVAWFDDDDWQHPRRLSLLVAALSSGASVAGSLRSWFVHAGDRTARGYDARLGVIFNGLAATRAAIGELRFDEHKRRAADTSWVQALTRGGAGAPAVVPEVLTWWLCHRRNLSNPAAKYSFPEPLARVRQQIGTADWADTDDHLERLVNRLGAAVLASRRSR